MEYTIVLTEAQNKALSYVVIDPQEWIRNAIVVRCDIAIDEIFKEECERISSEGGTISGTKEEIVLAAPIRTLREIEDERDAQRGADLLDLEQQQAT